MITHFKKIHDVIEKKLSPLSTEERSINDVLRFVLAEDVYASADVPLAEKAKTDGFIVRYKNGADFPQNFKIIGQSLPGEECNITLREGEAVRVFSGSHLPRNYSAFYTDEVVTENGDLISIANSDWDPSNIHKPGAIVKKDEILMRKDRLIRSGDIGLLALTGIEHIKVYCPPKIGIINVGSELREIYEPLTPGQTRNASQYLLKAKLKKLGHLPKLLSVVYDEYEEMKKVFSRALQRCDIIITTGGASLSKNDLTKRVWSELGVDFVLDGIEMYPGRNTAIGIYDKNHYVFTLSGNPVSAAIMFDLVVQPGLMQIIGNNIHPIELKTARLGSELPPIRYPLKILPGFMTTNGDDPVVNPTAEDTTRSMLGLASANCYIILKKHGKNYPIGEQVMIYPWKDF